MEAIVLAGGKGTRLQSAVKDRPKPLALIGPVPFLSYLLDYLVEQGVTHIILSVGYKKEQIISYYGVSYKGVPISYAIEEEPLLTGGAIRNSVKFLKGTGPVFVLNGDTFCPLNLKKALQEFVKAKAEVLIPVKYLEDTSRYGTIKFDNNLKINLFLEKRKGNGFINTGCYILHSRVYNALKEKVFSFERDFLEKKLSQYNFIALPIDDFFIDIGVPADYYKACLLFKNN